MLGDTRFGSTSNSFGELPQWQMLNYPMCNYPGYTLRRLSAAFMARLASRLGTLELRPAEATVLMVIAANPRVTQSEVGRHLDIASANMAPLAARLSKRGLIARHAVDRRSQGLTLTEAGRRVVVKARRIMEDLERDLVGGIPDEKRDGFLRVLAELSALYRNEPGK